MDANVQLVGNITREPELRFSKGEKAIAITRFGIAVNTKGRDEEQETSFYDVTCFGSTAENAAQLEKGTRVIVVGRQKIATFQRNDGSDGTAVEIVADEIGPSLRWASATVQRNERSDGPPARRTAQRSGRDSDGYSYDEEPF